MSESTHDTCLHQAQRAKGQLAVIEALRRGPKTRAELVTTTGLVDSTVWRTVRKLEQDCVIGVAKTRTAANRQQESVFELLSNDPDEIRERRERARRADKALAQPAFRHWQDTALFGEYWKAA